MKKSTVKYYREIDRFSKGRLFSEFEIPNESTGWTAIDQTWLKSVERKIDILEQNDAEYFEVGHLESLFYDVFGILDKKVQEGYHKDHGVKTEIVGSIIDGKLVHIDLNDPTTIPVKGKKSSSAQNYSKKGVKKQKRAKSVK